MENTAVLKEWFQRVDSTNTGNITASQLKTAFGIGNLNFSLSTVQQIIRMYDFDKNGTMNFQGEFSYVLTAIHLLCLMQYAFQIQLCRGRGFLVLDDIYEALIQIGFSLDTPAFYTLCEKFDRNQKGRFRLDDFISLGIFL